MSMKLLRGLFYMAHQFPHAQFIQKADDDVFIKLPQLVRDLGRFQGQADAYNNYGLHPYRIPYLYGGIVKFFNSRSGKVSFASGMGEFVNQELLQTIVREASVESDITTPDKRYTFNALIGLCFAPYDSTLANDYRWHHLDHEDVFLGYLVGLVGIGAYTRYENTPVKMKPTSKGFADMIKPNLVQYFRYDLCRAHDYLSGRNIRKTKMRDSVFVHHVLEEEIYLFLLVFFSNPKPFCEKLNAATEADGFDFIELPYTKAVEQYGDFCKTVKDRFPWTEESIFEDLVGGTFRTDALEQWRPLLDLPDPNPDQCEPTGCIPELYQRGPVPFHWWDLFTLYDAAIPREERRLGEKERNQVLPPLFMETTVRCDTVREPADNVN
ncbi:hypothetical protein AGDE_14381 [Angomonas deanei]|nr:hypothetical protein AGDE_14381 [Angomonas deanei]|eukprot:EPY20941.1 hypothetical protein AGDE_14381 [Angomonas deanei]